MFVLLYSMAKLKARNWLVLQQFRPSFPLKNGGLHLFDDKKCSSSNFIYKKILKTPGGVDTDTVSKINKSYFLYVLPHVVVVWVGVYYSTIENFKFHHYSTNKHYTAIFFVNHHRASTGSVVGRLFCKYNYYNNKHNIRRFSFYNTYINCFPAFCFHIIIKRYILCSSFEH